MTNVVELAGYPSHHREGFVVKGERLFKAWCGRLPTTTCYPGAHCEHCVCPRCSEFAGRRAPDTDQPAELPQWWEDPPDLDNLPPDPPAMLARTDGKTLLPRDAFIEVFGAPGCGKSWFTLLAIAANIRSGGRSLLWLWEGSKIKTYQKLRLLGVPDHLAADTDLLRVAVGPKRPVDTIAAGPNWVTGGDNPLAIIDTTAQAGGATNDAAEATEWMHTHIAPWRTRGATVIAVDHDTKTRPDTANFVGSRGSGAKTGHADLSLRVIGHRTKGKRLRSTLWTSERDGHTHVIVNKDRESWLAHSQGGDITATIHGTWRREAFALTIEPPTDNDDADADDLDQRVLAAIANAGDAGIQGARALRQTVGGTGRKIDEAAERLLAAGHIDKAEHGRSHVYLITDTGQAEVA